MNRNSIHNDLIRCLKGIAVAALVILLTAGCERLNPDKFSNVDCADCYQQKPEWVRLNVTVTINAENPRVPLVIYVGDVEDGKVDWVDTTSSYNYWVDVKPDQYYSVKATYKKGDKTIYAIDGDKIKLVYTSTDCDQSCYYQSGGNIDLRLLH